MDASGLLTVRSFEHRDLVSACSLANYHIEKTAIHFGSVPDSVEDWERWWVEGRARYPWVVAEIDGVFAGYAKCGVWRARKAYARTAETGIYVERHVQGRGVGRAMYLALIARAREAGFHLLVAGTVVPNPASMRLHESVGFSYVGTFTECGWKFGAWHDVAWWQMRLEEGNGA